MLKNSLLQPSFFLSASAPLFSSFFCFCLFLFQHCPFVSFSSCLSFLFSSHVPFFSTQKLSFQPKTILSSAQKKFFQPKRFSVFFSPTVFASAQNLSQFSPHHCFSLFLFCFSLFSFLLVLFLAHLFLASFSSFSASFFFSASFSFSCQLPRPKIFSLDASHFFYLNKSLFSSNLE